MYVYLVLYINGQPWNMNKCHGMRIPVKSCSKTSGLANHSSAFWATQSHWRSPALSCRSQWVGPLKRRPLRDHGKVPYVYGHIVLVAQSTSPYCDIATADRRSNCCPCVCRLPRLCADIRRLKCGRWMSCDGILSSVSSPVQCWACGTNLGLEKDQRETWRCWI